MKRIRIPHWLYQRLNKDQREADIWVKPSKDLKHAFKFFYKYYYIIGGTKLK